MRMYPQAQGRVSRYVRPHGQTKGWAREGQSSVLCRTREAVGWESQKSRDTWRILQNNKSCGKIVDREPLTRSLYLLCKCFLHFSSLLLELPVSHVREREHFEATRCCASRRGCTFERRTQNTTRTSTPLAPAAPPGKRRCRLLTVCLNTHQ